MQHAADSGSSTLPEHHDSGIASLTIELKALLDHVQINIGMIAASAPH
jgi:hypothetical protein